MKKLLVSLLACLFAIGTVACTVTTPSSESPSEEPSEIISETPSETPSEEPSETPSEEPFLHPEEIEGLAKTFTLDIYGLDVAEIKISDYVDENGSKDHEYSFVALDEEVIEITLDQDVYTVTPLKVGQTTAQLSATCKEGTCLSITFTFEVEDTTPLAPEVSQTEFSYDKSAGDVCEIPVNLNGNIISMINLDGYRIKENEWSYNQETSCIEFAEEVCLDLELQSYAVEVITTGGSVSFTLNVINTITTSFDEVTEKSVSLGKADGVEFAVNFNGTTVKEITFGSLVLSKDDYSVTENSLKIKDSFLKKTYLDDQRTYTVKLSNNDKYDFAITVDNVLFFTNYDETTIHDELKSNNGQNSLYQDSTRVDVVNAPEGSGMTGRVLKFTPHTEDVALDVHGVFTLAPLDNTSTWKKINFKVGKKYVMTFDYMTEGTTAGENFLFRSWTNDLKSEPLNTGNPGQKQSFKFEFTYDTASVGYFVFGKFLNGGSIYFDNVRILEIGDMPTVTFEQNYTGEDSYFATLNSYGYLWNKVLVDGVEVEYQVQENKMYLDTTYLKTLAYGSHTVVLSNDYFSIKGQFAYEDTRLVAKLTETEKTFVLGEKSLKLKGQFDQGITIDSIMRKGSISYDSSYVDGKEMYAGYITVEEDGIILSKELLDQVYGTCSYEVVCSNGNVLSFTLTSNGMFYTNFDETEIWGDPMREDPGVVEFVTGVEGFSGRVLKVETKNWNTHAPSTWFTRVMCLSNKTGAPGWIEIPFDNNKTYEFSFDIKVLMNGAVHNQALGYYYITKGMGEVRFDVPYEDEKLHKVTITMKGSDFAYFAIGLDPREGDLVSVLYLDNFAIKEVVVEANEGAQLTETSKTFTLGADQVKLAGQFGTGITLTTLTRKGTISLDTSNAEAKPISINYVTVEADGLVISKGLLDQVYGTCYYEATFSNGNVIPFSLTSNGIIYTNFDETDIWGDPMREDPGVAEFVTGVEGFSGRVLKVETKNWTKFEPASWYTRVMCLSNKTGAPGWIELPIDDSKTYEFSFDMKVIMNGAVHNKSLGYYYITKSMGETRINVSYEDEKLHHVTFTMKGSEFAYFAIGLDPREGDLVSVLYLDNFAIKQV